MIYLKMRVKMKVSSEESAISTRTGELAKLFESLGKEIDIAIAVTKDPVLRDVLLTMHKLGDRIATFFLRIKKILTVESDDNKVRFVIKYFFRNIRP